MNSPGRLQLTAGALAPRRPKFVPKPNITNHKRAYRDTLSLDPEHSTHRDRELVRRAAKKVDLPK